MAAFSLFRGTNMAVVTSSISRRFSIMFSLYNMGEESCCRIGTYGFEVKRKSERFTDVCPRCRQNLECGHFDEYEMYKSAGRMCSTITFSLLTNKKHGLLTKREVKMAGYWPSSFFARSSRSRSINTQEKNEADIQPSCPNKLGQ